VLTNMGVYLWWWRSAQQNKYYETYSQPLKCLYSISNSSKTQYSTSQIVFLTQYQYSSAPSTGWHVSSKPCCSPALKLTQSPIQILLLAITPTADFLEQLQVENLWSLNVMPVQRQFTSYPRTQYDRINNGGHTYKNTTH